MGASNRSSLGRSLLTTSSRSLRTMLVGKGMKSNHIFDQISNYNYGVKEVLANLENNNAGFDRLELNESMIKGCLYSDILRALLMNTTVKHVSITEGFLKPLNKTKACVILDLIRELPQMETLSLRIPKNLKSSSASLIYSAVRDVTTLTKLEIHGLRLEKTDEETDLYNVFQVPKNVRRLHLTDLSISMDNIATVAPFLTSLHQLPKLKELEIRMVDSDVRLPGRFFSNLCQSKSLKSLVLWNVAINSKQTPEMFQSLEYDQSPLKRLELWRCDLGPLFALLLGSMMQKNNTLETLIVSQVEFYGRDVSKLLTTLKQNATLKHLRLIPIGSPLDAKTAEAACDLMFHNHCLKSITFHSDMLNIENCTAIASELRKKDVIIASPVGDSLTRRVRMLETTPSVKLIRRV